MNTEHTEDKQYRVRLNTEEVEQALTKYDKPLTLLFQDLLSEYNRNKNLRSKLSKKHK